MSKDPLIENLILEMHQCLIAVCEALVLQKSLDPNVAIACLQSVVSNVERDGPDQRSAVIARGLITYLQRRGTKGEA